MKIIEKNNLELASKILRNGGLIAFPTETVFGLGVIYDNKDSYQRLIDVKRRPPEKPFTLMCGDVNDIFKYAYINEKAKKLIDAFMPGQFTIILKAKENLPSYVISKEGNVGIRVSSDELVSNLIKKVGKPLLVPSADKSGERPAHNVNDVLNAFNENELDGVIEGESISNTPSTIVMMNDDDIIIIRKGLISEDDIKKVLGE